MALHTHCTPDELGDYGDAQKEALKADPAHQGEKGTINIA